LKKVAPIPSPIGVGDKRGRLVRRINHPRYVFRFVWISYKYTDFSKSQIVTIFLVFLQQYPIYVKRNF